MKKATPFLLIILLCTLVFSFKIKSVRAWEHIYIRADGSIDPPTAPITTTDNITYTLTANLVNQTINIERNNTVLDGNGHVLQAKGVGTGIDFENSDGQLRNVTIKNFHIDDFSYGISAFPEYGSFLLNKIFNNTFTSNGYGLFLHHFHYSSITGNTFVNNGRGVYLTSSYGNEIHANNMTNNARGIEIDNSAWNQVYHNFFLNNTRAIRLTLAVNQTFYHNNFVNQPIPVDSDLSHDFWNTSYPLGGNYWSHLNLTDIYSGPYQNESGSDGIGDSLYTVWDQANIDYYPLVNPYWNPADINHDLKVDIFDVVLCANAYGSTPADIHWNPLCDLAEPFNKVDIFDIVTICINYGEGWN
jgi:parallel beta-helix repeat protein